MSTLESQLSNSQQGEVESSSKIQFSKHHGSSNSIIGPRDKDNKTTLSSMMSLKSPSNNAIEAFTVEQLDGRLEK
jgi:ABC-type iron transport system FetAB ATPase subunit